MKRPDESHAHAHEVGKQGPRDSPLRTGGSLYGRLARIAGRIIPNPAAVLMTFVASACLTGCSFLKPAPDTSRHFVLTTLPATEMANVEPAASRVDVVRVKTPAYLFNSSLAVRKGANEIDYPPATLWAERLDTEIPRVLAADLSSLLPSEQIRVAAGSSEEIAREIGVIIEQFDVSSSGQAVLVAKWRIFSPGGETILHSGDSRLSRSGPAPDTDPSGAVGTLSDLIADLSRQLAEALNGTWPGAKGAASRGHEIPRHRSEILAGSKCSPLCTGKRTSGKRAEDVWVVPGTASRAVAVAMIAIQTPLTSDDPSRSTPRLAFESSRASHTDTNIASRIQDGSFAVP